MTWSQRSNYNKLVIYSPGFKSRNLWGDPRLLRRSVRIRPGIRLDFKVQRGHNWGEFAEMEVSGGPLVGGTDAPRNVHITGAQILEISNTRGTCAVRRVAAQRNLDPPPTGIAPEATPRN